jgi:hypothetical protein
VDFLTAILLLLVPTGAGYFQVLRSMREYADIPVLTLNVGGRACEAGLSKIADKVELGLNNTADKIATGLGRISNAMFAGAVIFGVLWG